MSRPYDSIIYKLHSALKITDFWPQYIEALSEELDLEITELIENSKLINDYRSGLQDYLTLLSNKFGYTPNLYIDASIEFLEQELLSIPYRIRKKTTYNGYRFIFRQIQQNGEVYNYFYNNTQLVKAIDWGKIYSTISGYSNIDYSNPFVKFSPDINYSTILTSDLILLDTDRTLDENPGWTLDNNTNFSTPTKHLGIEYYADEIVTISGSSIEYLIYDTYFKYLDTGVEYNRRNCVFPHTGILITSFINKDGAYDSFNPSLGYTVPTIQLDSAVTVPYLTSSSGIVLNNNQTYYASIGTGKKTLPTIASGYNTIFNKNNLLSSYTLDEPDYSSTVIDHSKNINNGVVVGTEIKTNSILGKSINFNGATYVSTSGFLITSGIYNYSFWFNPNNIGLSNDQVYLFDQNQIQARYTYSAQTLDIYVAGSLINNYSFIPNNNYYVNLIINNDTNKLVLLSNGTTIASGVSISAITPSVYPLYIGTDISTNTKDYLGKLDNFNVINNAVNQATNKYINDNKIGVIATLSGFAYRKKLQFQELVNISGLWTGMQTYFPLQSYNEEFLFNFIDTNTIYTGTLIHPTIIPGYLQIHHQAILGGTVIDTIAQDDGNGNIVGQFISGTINYDTNAYTIYPYLTNNVYQHIVATSGVSSIINHFTNFNVIPTTFSMFYEITNTEYIAIDDGLGNIIGTGITSGNLNYSTGQLNINFSQTTQSGMITSASYNYKTVPTIPSGNIFLGEYKVTNKVEITEMAIEDSTKTALAYQTFPNVMGDGIYNEISFGSLIKL